MKLDRGAIVLVDLDPTVGSEQRGIRPCAVISDPVAAPRRSPERPTCAQLELPTPCAAPWSASHRWARRYHPRPGRADGSILESIPGSYVEFRIMLS